MKYENYQRVPVYSLDGYPLSPCHPARARKLLRDDRAVVYHVRGIFGIKLIDKMRSECEVQDMTLRIDPGAEISGFAVTIDNDNKERQVLGAYELRHHAKVIKAKLTHRSKYRRNRRYRLRYRARRGINRRRRVGVLRPSIQSIVDDTMRIICMFRQVYPVSGLSIEYNKFDTQLMMNPNIRGAEYKRGTLFGWQTKAYILNRDGYMCAYCDARGKLEVDHVQPRSIGSDRVDNLVASCRGCNNTKGNQPVEIFLKDRPELLGRILQRLQRSNLTPAAHVGTALPNLIREVKATGLNVQVADATTVAWNRQRFGVPKTHCYDAALHGQDLQGIVGLPGRVIQITPSNGRSKQKVGVDQYGTPLGKSFREQQRLPKHQRQRNPAVGHSDRHQRYGSRMIGTGDIVTFSRDKKTTTGRAVIRDRRTRIRVGNRTASIAVCRLIARNPRHRLQWVQPNKQANKPSTTPEVVDRD